MNSHFLKNSLIYAFIIGNSFIISASESKKKSDTIKSDIKGISGSIPKALNEFIEDLKELDTDIEGFCNRLVLCGVPGNGKSTFAAKIAETTGSEFKLLNGGSLVGPLTGIGAQKIDEAFQEALNITIEKKKRVVICIDEADVIAIKPDAHNEDHLRSYIQTLKSLLVNLDNIKDNPLIVFVVTTNHYERFDPALVSRFQDNVIKIPNPNGEMRKEVINYYINEINSKHKKKFKIEEREILNLVKKTKGISIRGIRGIVYKLHRHPSTDLAELLEKYKEKPVSKPWFTTNEKIGLGGLGLTATGIIVQVYLHRNPSTVVRPPAASAAVPAPAGV